MIVEERGKGKIELCAFCRKPSSSSSEEEVNRLKKLIECKNCHGYYQLAAYYAHGNMGFPQDVAKANELSLKAGELGRAVAYYNLGIAYETGRGVEVDKKKAKHFYELAAMNGNVNARNHLGWMEAHAGNIGRACKHYIIAARAGEKASLVNVKLGYMRGIVTKDEYANTLRACQSQQDEMKSDDRDKAMAARRSGLYKPV